MSAPLVKHLFVPLQVGAVKTSNRVFMAPLTRCRAGPGDVPGPLSALYYSQRASAGLIVTEATQISPLGKGYPATPGIYSKDQVEGWKPTVQAVHDKGGKMFLQLWHVGRISHSSFHPEDGLPIAPSAVAPRTGKTATASFAYEDFEVPRAASEEDIKKIVQQYKVGAQNSLEAGFDGVEIHGANGYLIDQFLQDSSNKRTDTYGGSVENRARFLFEVLEAVLSVVPANRVGIRLSPYSSFNDMSDSDYVGLFTHVIKRLDTYSLAYLHLVEPRASGGDEDEVKGMPSTSKLFRPLFRGVLVSAGGYTGELAEKAIADGDADAVCFGRQFIANPDLPQRLQQGAALNPYNRKTFYGGDAAGYTDYPFLA